MFKLALKLSLFFKLIFLIHFIIKIVVASKPADHHDFNVLRSNTTDETSYSPLTDYMYQPEEQESKYVLSIEPDGNELESDANMLEPHEIELESDGTDILFADDDDGINAAQRFNRRAVRRRCRSTCVNVCEYRRRRYRRYRSRRGREECISVCIEECYRRYRRRFGRDGGGFGRRGRGI
ncbi:9357_t:CDS:1 [Ambispora leptoticha]|uniref:9357_t:CDS:1 n=1 Tax=Ambispora leptoticha TaxID=144679 RepID=A0A9N8ZVJ4_9GLOM|nr:9357_t:CDS:1 [Ambispora leptoticha]